MIHQKYRANTFISYNEKTCKVQLIDFRDNKQGKNANSATNKIIKLVQE